MANNTLVTDKSYTATELMTECLTSYSADVVSTKYAHYVDGLKKVHRRILFCLGTQIDKDAMTALIGETSKLHQGGDSSIYSALIRLSQPFSVGIPLIYCPGNYGDYTKPESAGHPRYLEIASSEFARDLFFNGVYQKSIPMTYSKDFRRMEPQYFIPRLPTSLLLNTLTIGYGFKSTTPQLNFSNLCDIVMKFAECRANTASIYPPYRDVAELMLPDYPVNNYIRNKADIIEAYGRGEFDHPIYLDGTIELSSTSFRLRSTPYGIIPGNVLSSVLALMQKNKKHWLHEALRDLNNYGGNDEWCDFLLDFKQNTKIFSMLDPLRKLFQCSDVIRPQYYFVRNDKIALLSPYQLVDEWYAERSKSIMSGIKGKQADLQMELQRLLAYLIICDHTDEAIRIIRGSDDEDAAVRALADRFPDLTRMQSRILANAKVSTLTKKAKSDLMLLIEKTQQELHEIQNTYGKLHETIYHDAQFLKKKYGVPRKTKCTADFLGYVHINKSGVIQFMDESDLLDILKNFRLAKQIDIQYWQKEFPFRHPVNEGRFIGWTERNLPREFACTKMVVSPIHYPYTLIFMDGGVSVAEGMKLAKDDRTLTIPITEKFYGIGRDGTVIKTDISQYSQRKSVSKGAQSDLIYALPAKSKDMIVIHMNPEVPNTIRFDRILCDKDYLGKLTVTPMGETMILATLSTNTKLAYIGLPQECLNKVATNIMRIANLGFMFKNGNRAIIELTKTKDNLWSKYLTRHKELSFICNLELPTK